ncbi:MAG: UDP-glucose 4-epimerase GalE [Bacteroidetes bacterium]|nr:MAG: UDP-glucose 4-epimerase GalE [Bacteroidota bacterium]
MKILVTGGTGYIGSHTVVELQQAGFEVIIADNLINSEASVVDAIGKITGIIPVFEKVDLSDSGQADSVFQKHTDIKAVIHFAALKAVGDSVERPLEYYRNNIFSLINLLSSMSRHGVKHIVFSSSCTVYGQPDTLPVKESTARKDAESPYGNTKKIAEDILEDEVRAGSLRCIALRYFNPIGAHPTAMIGELPLGVPDNLVPYITQTAIGIREKLMIFGNDYETKDGTPVRDYIHVVDLAQAHVVALKRMMEDKQISPWEIFNLGTGNGFSVLEVINSFEKVSDMKLNYAFTDRRQGDIEKVWADTEYANLELGWKAERDLDEMMRSAWDWELALNDRNKKINI